jgi:diguanylate cyclase (GGDEF)-like protein
VEWRFVAIWVATLALIWVTYAFAHRAIVKSMELDLAQRLQTYTLLLEDHASRALDGVVSRLEALAALSGRGDLADRDKFSQQLRDLLFDDTIVRSLSLVDANGMIVVSSNRASVGRQVTEPIGASIGPPPAQPRKGARFSGSLAQRDLTEVPAPSVPGNAAPMIWLAQMDAKTSDLAGHRWIVAINSGFFQNFWSAATRSSDFQAGLFSYTGQRLVSLDQGSETSARVGQGVQEALQARESGELVLPGRNDWLIRYRASARHPLAFVMWVSRASQAQEQAERTAALRWAALAGSLVATAVIALFFISSLRQRRFAWANQELQQQAYTDVLTGLANRRAFNHLMPQVLTRAASQGLPFSLMVLDMDHFKSVNDRWGHLAGDAVLQEMAARWKAVLRSQDFIARIGGEEFCVVLPGTGLRQAEFVALKLIEATRREPVAIPGAADPLAVTVSIGLLGLDACPGDADLESLLQAADAALLRAKEGGRNQFVTAHEG